MDEYVHKLNASFKLALIDYLTENREHSISNFLLIIYKIRDVYPDPQLNGIKLHDLLSGDTLEIDFWGSARVMHDQGNSKTSKHFNYMCNRVPVKWNREAEEFEVGPIAELITAGLNHP